MTIDSNIFNTNKTDYETPSLFFGQPKGLFDTVNKRYPEIWDLYRSQRSLDWSFDEFDYSVCNVDFKTCDRSTYECMLRTLAWQWESDSMYANNIAVLLAPFITSSELWAAIQQITNIEITHSASYSEIVRSSFDNPEEVISDILSKQEALQRLQRVSRVFSDVYELSHKYALGQVEYTQENYNKVFMVFVALLCLERIQFAASFAVTFAICDTGMFQPIGKTVQKIAQDELEIHADFDKAVIKYELTTERGKKAFEMLQNDIKSLVDEVVESELKWVDYLLSEGRAIVGLNADVLKKWVLFNAKDVYRFLNIKEVSYTLPKDNPLKFMEKWLDISKNQPSPQEESIAAYRVNILKRTDNNEVFEVDF